jgi:hypothetical protein
MNQLAAFEIRGMPATIRHRIVFPFVPYKHEDYSVQNCSCLLFCMHLNIGRTWTTHVQEWVAEETFEANEAIRGWRKVRNDDLYS